MEFQVRVLVTGLGVVSPAGLDAATTWRSVAAGRSGIGPIPRARQRPSGRPGRRPVQLVRLWRHTATLVLRRFRETHG
ncbi:MAG TPA: beta-ketoacyl synthase N-terminal-like domain-containing protein [Anaerolineae bacterium]|nr:beta-ketoacyl synthase N-terminal-like domain-containing protein [Anaerolineae bacterium]